jgi:hypothetical protein
VAFSPEAASIRYNAPAAGRWVVLFAGDWALDLTQPVRHPKLSTLNLRLDRKASRGDYGPP